MTPTLFALAFFGLALHVYTTFKARTTLDSFLPWLAGNLEYVGLALVWCAVGILARDSVMEILGWTKPDVYIFLVCYGGGHLISKSFDIKEGTEVRKAKQ
jgi:hypothetical protein